jgi:hypothetical protein
MQEYAENVLIPCVESVVDEYPLKVPANLSSWEKPRKLDAVKINIFTVW